MKNKYQIIIVGAGPIGLYVAGQLEKKKISYLLLEASDHIGGQLINLYPEKEIVDIPGIKSIKAKDYITLLGSKIDINNIEFNSVINEIEETNGLIFVSTSNKKYMCEKLILTIGLGFSKPRPLGVINEDKCKNILYSLKDFSFLKNKKVAIFGGGDSALDWAKAISEITDDAHLIHRRTEFRGNVDTIKNSHNLHIHLPYIPKSIEISDDLAKSVTITKVVQNDENEENITIDVDYILVNYGNIPANNPFNFDYDGSFIKVNKNFEARKNIYVIGDAASYDNKKRRIAPGIIEANKLLEII